MQQEMPMTPRRRLPPSHPIKKQRSLEGFWHTAKQTVPRPESQDAALPATLPHPQPTSVPSAVLQHEEPLQPKKKRFSWLAMPLLALAGMAAGFLVQSLLVGQIMLALYALYALWRRVPSRTTFTLGMLTFVATVLFFAVRQNGQQAQNYAIYTFWLVVIGTISMIFEIRRSQRAIRQQRQG